MTSTKFESKPLFTRQQLTALLLPYLKPTDHICDAGCGLGYLSLALSPHAAHITAAERDAAALSVLRQELDARGIAIPYPQLDVHFEPQKRNT